jgi:hypothetical protein
VVENGVTAKLKGHESMQLVAKSTVNVLEMKVRKKKHKSSGRKKNVQQKFPKGLRNDSKSLI